MAKTKTVYICQNCGTTHPKWQGQCKQCGEWNTLVEEVEATEKKSGLSQPRQLDPQQLQDKLVPWQSVEGEHQARQRISSGIGEFDRVLGYEGEENGGMVPGAVMLLGGEPGIGKSTLLTQLVIKQLRTDRQPAIKAPILYICGEESPSQINLRIKRILDNEQINYSENKTQGSGSVRSTDHSKNETKQTRSETNSKQLELGYQLEQLKFVTSTDVDEIISLITEEKPHLVVVDSIQAVTTQDLTGAAGSVGQVREAADRLAEVAKRNSIPLFLVGHVTKEGTIAGPKTLEHIVDTVLELSGERTGELRLLRTLKNRFGATDEVGVFRVAEFGLQEVTNPSQFFLEHAEVSVPGSATSCVMEGTRPLLIEVQALVNKSQLAMPRRVGRGVRVSRIQVLAAVLQKHARLPLGSHDIFLSVAGGYQVDEAGVDLGLVMALVSSLQNKALPKKAVFIGEIGLLGEIRSVRYLARRIKEAERLGFKKIYSKQTHGRVKELLNELGLN